MSEIAKRIFVFVLSMLPVIELRGAIPVGFAFKFELWETLLLSIVGNILIIPFIILLFARIMLLMKKFSFTRKIALSIESRTQRKSQKVENLIFFGLMMFVAIPLPGTGAWTGALVASLFDMDKKKAALSIFSGVITAGLIMTFGSQIVKFFVELL